MGDGKKAVVEVGKEGEEGRELVRCYAKSCLSLHASSSSSSSIAIPNLPPEQEEPPAVRRPVLAAPTPSGPNPTPPTNTSEPSGNQGRSPLRCPSRSALSAPPTSDATAPFHNPNTSHPDDTATRAFRSILPINTKDPNENEGRELVRCSSRSALSDIPLNDAPVRTPNSAHNPDTPDTDDTATRAVRTTLSRPTAAPKEDGGSNQGRSLVRCSSRSAMSIIPQSEASVPPSQNQKADTDDTATRAVRTILPTPATSTTQADGDNRGRLLYRCPSKSALSPPPVSDTTSTEYNAARASQPTPDRSNTNNTPKSKPNPSPKPNTPSSKPNNTPKPNSTPKPNNTPNSKPSN